MVGAMNVYLDEVGWEMLQLMASVGRDMECEQENVSVTSN